jgi:hypothetical protein
LNGGVIESIVSSIHRSRSHPKDYRGVVGSRRAHLDEAAHLGDRIPQMLITKLDAARRQIDGAIDLHFNEGDELAIHTLVGAAHILITDLSKAANLQSILDRYIVPDWRWKFEKAIRAPQNFIKHADTDAEATLDFNPHNTELMLFIDIEMFKELTGSATDAMQVFLTYAAATWGKAAFAAAPQVVLDELSALAGGQSKREFFAAGMEAIRLGGLSTTQMRL